MQLPLCYNPNITKWPNIGTVFWATVDQVNFLTRQLIMHQTHNHHICLQHPNDPLHKIPCTTSGCVCKFIWYQDLNQHVQLDKHTIITNLPANDPPLSPHTSSLPGSQALPSHTFEPLYPELEHLLDIPPENIFDHSGDPSYSTVSSPSGQPSVTPFSFNHPSTAPYSSHKSVSVDESNSEASSSKSSPSSGAHSQCVTVEDYVKMMNTIMICKMSMM